jgi:hypothetical protein
MEFRLPAVSVSGNGIMPYDASTDFFGKISQKQTSNSRPSIQNSSCG